MQRLDSVETPQPNRRAAMTLAAPALLALLAGAAHGFSMAWPWSLGRWGPAQGQALPSLQWAALVTLVWLLGRTARAKDGFKLAWLFGLNMLGSTFWWLFISMHVYAGLASPLAVLAILALAGFLGLYYAAAGALYVRLRPTHWAGRASLFAALWLLAELARVRLFTGFPWGEGGYAYVNIWGPLLAPWVGVHGLTLLAALSAAIFAGVLTTQRVRPVWALLTAALLLLMPTPSWLTAPPQPTPAPNPTLRAPLQVALVQGNIAQGEKFNVATGVADALDFYGAQLHQASSASLLVLPETALPLLPSELPPGYWQALQTRYASGQQAVLLGMPLVAAASEGAAPGQERYTNSVVGLKPFVPTPYRYDKHHLVPFGEFIPPWFKWFTQLMHIPLGDFARGSAQQPPFEWMGERLAPHICYEDLFGEELGLRFANPALAPTVLVNVSNLAWFGDSVAIDQHLHIARMRALEFARPVIRATNTGATVVINAQGQVTHALPRLTRGVLLADVQGNDTLTFYARWVAQWGLAPWYGLAGLVVGLAWLQAALQSRGLAHK